MSICKLGDINNAGGKLMRTASTVFVNNLPVVLHPSWLTNHPPWKGPHTLSWTMFGSKSVYCENQPVVYRGMPTTCGHIIIGGSTDTFCGP